jgi:HEAT repeat protein
VNPFSHVRNKELPNPDIKFLESSKNVDGLIQIVTRESLDQEIRKDALRSLAQIGKPAVGPLFSALMEYKRDEKQSETRDKNHRKKESGPVSFFNSLFPRNELKELLKENTQSLILEAFEEFTEKDLRPILKLLDSRDPFVRQTAFQVVCWAKLDAARTQIIEGLSNADDEIKLAASLALCYITDERAIGPLIKALGDEDPVVRSNAADALGRYTMTNEHVGPLIKLLESGDEFASLPAASSLGKIGDRTAIPALLRHLNDDDRLIREEVVNSLGLLGDRDIFDKIRPVFNDKEIYVRSKAVQALGRLDRERTLELLHDSERYVMRPSYEKSIQKKSVKSGIIAALLLSIFAYFAFFFIYGPMLVSITSFTITGNKLYDTVFYSLIFSIIIFIGGSLMMYNAFHYSLRHNIDVSLKGFWVDQDILITKLKKDLERHYRVKENKEDDCLVLSMKMKSLENIEIILKCDNWDNRITVEVEKFALLNKSDQAQIVKSVKSAIPEALMTPSQW